MQKIYLRVQQDVRTGPFTLEEILQFKFTTEDLIWVIGQSEDWLPVMEIPSLQPYFVQQNDILIVKEDALASAMPQQFSLSSVDETDISANQSTESELLDNRCSSNKKEEALAIGSIKDPESEKKRQTRLDSFFSNQGKNAFTANKEKKSDQIRVEQEEEDDIDSFFKNKRALIGIGALLLAFFVGNTFFSNNKRNQLKPIYSVETPLQTQQATTLSSAYQPEASSLESNLNTLTSIQEEPIEKPAEAASQAQSNSIDAYIDSLRAVSSDREPGLTKADYARVKPSPYLVQVLKRRQEAKKYEKITTMKQLREASAKKAMASKNLPFQAHANPKSKLERQGVNKP